MADHNPPEPATGRPGLPGGIKPYSNADADRGLIGQTRDVYTEWRKRQQPKSAVTQADVMAGGESDVVVGYTGRMKREVDKVLAERLIAIKRAKETAGSAQPRSNLDTVVDRLVEEHASEIIGDNTLTPEKLAIVNAVIYDTLLNKAAAVSMLIAEDPGRLEGLRQTPFLRKFTTTLQPRVEPMAAGYRSDLADIYGVTPANLQKTVDELESLDMLRVKTIEANFPFRRGSIQSVADRIRGFVQPIDDYGGHRSPLFDLIETSIHPRSFIERSGNIWQDRIIDKFLGERGQRNGLLQQEFGENANPAEVWARNPDRYWALLEQANKTALGDAAPEMAKKLFEKQKTDPSSSNIKNIDNHIARLSGRKIPPELGKEIPDTEITGLESQLNTLRTQLATKNTEIDALEKPVNDARKAIAKAQQEADEYQTAIDDFNADLATMPAVPAIPVGATPDQARGITDAFNAELANLRKQVAENIKERAKALGVVRENNELLAQLREPAARDIYNRARTAKLVERDEIEAQITRVSTDLATRRTRREAQQRILKGEMTQEERLRLRGLEKWRNVALSQLSTIMARVFDARNNPEFARDKLTSTREINGRVEGCEKIRQSMLGTIGASTSAEEAAKFAYDPQRLTDRLLLDEYFISRSIVELLHLQAPININIPVIAVAGRVAVAATNGMVAIEQRMAEIRQTIQANAGNAALVGQLTQEYLTIGNEVAKQVLPHMQRSGYDMADLFQYITRKKLEIGAATGDTFNPETPFQPPAELHRFEPERVISAGLGNVETGYEGNNLMVNWEGDAPNSFGANNLPVRTQVDLQVAPNNGNREYDFRIRADQDLVAALQGVAFAVVPPQIQAALYPGGVLDPSRARDQWINVAEGTNIGVRPNINALHGANPVIDNRVNLNNLYDASLAAHVLTMNPDERRELLGAMEEINLVLPAPLGNRIINMDNGGELWLVNPADRNDRQELRDMLVQQVRQGMQVANLARLNPEQMLAANQILRVNVLNQLGGAIFNSLSGRGRRII